MGDMTPKQLRAYHAVPQCVETDCLDQIDTFAHVTFRVEHPIELFTEGEDFCNKREAKACQNWLKKYAPHSKYASVKL